MAYWMRLSYDHQHDFYQHFHVLINVILIKTIICSSIWFLSKLARDHQYDFDYNYRIIIGIILIPIIIWSSIWFWLSSQWPLWQTGAEEGRTLEGGPNMIVVMITYIDTMMATIFITWSWPPAHYPHWQGAPQCRRSPRAESERGGQRRGL